MVFEDDPLFQFLHLSMIWGCTELRYWWVAIPFGVDIEPWCCFIVLYITISEYIKGLQVDLKYFKNLEI